MPRVELVMVARVWQSHITAEPLWQALLAFSVEGVGGKVVVLVVMKALPGNAVAVVVLAGAKTLVHKVRSITPIITVAGGDVLQRSTSHLEKKSNSN